MGEGEELNKIIGKTNPFIVDLFSEKGKKIYFPSKGIVSQAAEAKGTAINATVGMALNNKNEPMGLPCIKKRIDFDPKDIFAYAPSFGRKDLREDWLDKVIKEENPHLKGLTSLPVVTCGLTHGLNMTAFLFVNPGDKVILADKFWSNYKLIFENFYGAELVTYNTFKNDGFDLESLQKTLSDGKGKKILLLNFPNNPSGYSPTNKEIKELISILKKEANKNPVIVICDDAYNGFIYEDDIYKNDIFSELADLHENLLVVKADGISKKFSSYGLRIGFLTYACKGISQEACLALEHKTAGAIRSSVSNVPMLSQTLARGAINAPCFAKEREELFEEMKERYQTVRKILETEKYKEFFTPLPFNSGYFLCIALNDAEDARQELLKMGVGTISIKGQLLRIAYSSVPKERLEELFERIYLACNKI